MRIRCRRAAFGLALLTAAGSVVAASPAPPAVQKAIQSQYDRQAAVAKARNPATVRRFMAETTTPDCVFTDHLGQKWSRKQVTDYWADQASRTKSIEGWENKIRRFSSPARDTAVVIVGSRSAWTAIGPDKKPHRLVSESTNRDTWVRSGGTWKLQRSIELSGRALTDGKPHPAPATPKKGKS